MLPGTAISQAAKRGGVLSCETDCTICVVLCTVRDLAQKTWQIRFSGSSFVDLNKQILVSSTLNIVYQIGHTLPNIVGFQPGQKKDHFKHSTARNPFLIYKLSRNECRAGFGEL